MSNGSHIRLVRGKRIDKNSNSGYCPHCFKEIDDFRSAARCRICKKQISWTSSKMSREELEIDKTEWEKSKEKFVEQVGIKLCPFCGEPVGAPILESLDEDGCILRIGCYNCGCNLRDGTTKIDIRSINECSEELIEWWNKRS